MNQTVDLTAYGMRLIAADVEERTIALDELTQLITPEQSADGETCMVIDGRDVLYDGELVGRIAVASNPGTPPDTSLWLGAERKQWLTAQGGIQPTIRRLIDEAMRK